MRKIIPVLMLAMVGFSAVAKSKALPPAKTAEASAEAPSQFSGKLLSYEALVELPKAKRMKYIKDVVDLLATMESFNNKYTVAERSRLREFHDQVAQLMKAMSLLPEANADNFDDTPPDVDVSKIIPAWNGAEWNCGRGAVFDYVMRACMVTNASGQTNFTPQASVEEAAFKCPEGTHEVPHYRGDQSACIPAANWALIPAERKSGIAGKGFLSPRFLRDQPLEAQRQLVLGEGPGSLDSTPVLPASQGAPSVPTVYGAGYARIPRPTAAVGTGSPQPSAVVGNGTSAPSTSPASCEPAAQVCKKLSATDRATAINRFRATAAYQGEKANICIAGGFASKYVGTEKKPSTCDIRRSLTLGPEKSTTPCKADEALCNPVLFCVGAKNSAKKFEPVTFCVKKSGDRVNRPITDSCAAKYGQLLAKEIPLLDCSVDPKLTGAKKHQAQAKCDSAGNIKGEACDPAYMPADAQFKALWESLIADTKKLRDVWCGKLDFAALFCRECEIVNDKIYAMNKAATGGGCPEVRAPATGRGGSQQQDVPVVPAAAGGSTGIPEGPRGDGR